MEKYAYPEVFVQGIASSPLILKRKNEYILVTEQPTDEEEYDEIYGHIIYENVLDLVLDLIKPEITRELIVIKEFTGKDEMKALLIPKGIKPCLIEIKGASPYVFYNEGDEIKEGDKLAYVVTRKGEVRVIRSPCEGIVVLNINITWEKPEKYIMVVVGKDELRQIIIRKST